MATVYGNEADRWRAALNYTTSQSNTSVSITAKIGFQSINNGFQISSGISGSVTVNGSTASFSGQGFSSDTSETKTTYYKTKTASVSRGTSAKTVTISGTVKNTSGFRNGTSNVSATVSVPKLASYTVSYNANGGSGAPANQTKYYGQTLKLSSTKPTRTGYTFAGWGTSAATTTVSYSPGGSYTRNASITLYAVWTQNKKLTIEYNANGGYDAPESQTHVYGTTSQLSEEVLTRDGYWFLGWSTSSSATTATYKPGATYSNNSFNDGDTVTLYAVWKKLTCLYAEVPNGQTVEVVYVWVPNGKTVDSVYFWN